jgi:Fe2+ transport system protein FeoA
MRRRHRGGRGGRQDEASSGDGPKPLCECAEGVVGVIVSNGDLKSLEMGLFLGARVEVLRNHHRDSNLLVAVGPARYAVARSTARLIFIE